MTSKIGTQKSVPGISVSETENIGNFGQVLAVLIESLPFVAMGILCIGASEKSETELRQFDLT